MIKENQTNIIALILAAFVILSFFSTNVSIDINNVQQWRVAALVTITGDVKDSQCNCQGLGGNVSQLSANNDANITLEVFGTKQCAFRKMSILIRN